MTTTKSIPFGAMTNALPIIDPSDLDEPYVVPDRMFQNPNLLDTATILKVRYKDDPTVLVDSGTIICYDPNNLNNRVYPDCYVAFDVPAGAIFAQNGYLTWQVGKSPDFALEIASETTAKRDITVKRELYETIGVREYWRFDPSGGEYYGVSLAGDRLIDGSYQPIEIGVNAADMLSGYSALLGLSLCVQEGVHPIANTIRLDRLLLYDPSTGEYLRNLAEAESDLEMSQDVLRDTQDALSKSDADLEAAQARIRELEAKLRRR